MHVWDRTIESRHLPRKTTAVYASTNTSVVKESVNWTAATLSTKNALINGSFPDHGRVLCVVTLSSMKRATTRTTTKLPKKTSH